MLRGSFGGKVFTELLYKFNDIVVSLMPLRRTVAISDILNFSKLLNFRKSY